MHLEEDGLILWQSLVRNASVLEPQLIDLASVAIGQITSDPDSMGRSLAIVDSYALICGAELYQVSPTSPCRRLFQVESDRIADAFPFLLSCQHFATQLANAFKSCFLTSTPTDFIDVRPYPPPNLCSIFPHLYLPGLTSTLPNSTSSQILTSLSLHITIVPISLWGPAFASAGLLSKLITDASQPNVGTALPHYASLFGRMILADANGFLELMRMEGVGKGAFLDLWWTAVSFRTIRGPLGAGTAK